ncbi:8438_t:CDS:2, partial [Racocetra fulgida]
DSVWDWGPLSDPTCYVEGITRVAIALFELEALDFTNSRNVEIHPEKGYGKPSPCFEYFVIKK